MEILSASQRHHSFSQKGPYEYSRAFVQLPDPIRHTYPIETPIQTLAAQVSFQISAGQLQRVYRSLQQNGQSLQVLSLTTDIIRYRRIYINNQTAYANIQTATTKVAAVLCCIFVVEWSSKLTHFVSVIDIFTYSLSLRGPA